MSGSGYHSRYSRSPREPYIPDRPRQSWTPSWSLQQQSHPRYPAPTGGYSRNRNSIYSRSSPSSGQSSKHSQLRTHQQYHSSSAKQLARVYQQRGSRYNSSYGSDSLPQSYYGGRQQQNWHRNQGYKRAIAEYGETLEPKSNSLIKRKKLPHPVPIRKQWTIQEAEMALKVEKEYNERSRNHSLLIRFPDLELNRNIVEKLHPEIESVFFQNSYAPRFCTVTLNESEDADAVIRELNKQKFGRGYLTAEYKDKEDDIRIDPEDIDPTTLFVGNFADEVTLDELTMIYPKHSNIQIVSKMKTKPKKNAFVSFNNVADAIEAFKRTYNKLFHSKNLTVKFRKFNGPIGMPGETKQQNPSKAAIKNTTNETNGSVAKIKAIEQGKSTEEVRNVPQEHVPSSSPLKAIVSVTCSPQISERCESQPEDDNDGKRCFGSYTQTAGHASYVHRPKVKTEVNKVEIKLEPPADRIPQLKQEPMDVEEYTTNEPSKEHNVTDQYPPIKSESGHVFGVDENAVTIKQEPMDETVSESENMDTQEEGQLLGVRDFNSVYGSLKGTTSTQHEAG